MKNKRIARVGCLITLFLLISYIALRTDDADPQVRTAATLTQERITDQALEADALFAPEPKASHTHATEETSFRQWLAAYQDKSNAADQTSMLADGIRLAMQRRTSMLTLIRNDPDAALAVALSYAEYAALPETIQTWVEEPFSTTGLLDVQIVCGSNHVEQLHYILEDDGGNSWNLSMPVEHRVALSKRNLPVQGIRLDDIATIRGQVFQVVSGADAALVSNTWASGQAHPDRCFTSGEIIQGDGVTAVAGGRTFRFQNEANLKRVEAALNQAEARPGLNVGSQWIMAETRGDGFPFEEYGTATETMAYNSTTGAKTSFFIQVDFSDRQGTPCTASTLDQVIDLQVNNALAEYSYNTTSLSGSVTDFAVRVISPSGDYVGGTKDYNDLYDEAIASYIALGNDDPRTSHDTVGIIFETLGYSWTGLASLGGQKMWLNGTLNADTILHEFGHNYGLGHANYWVHDNANPASTDPVDPAGANEEYGDGTDVMGDGAVSEGHFHMAAKQYLGWIGINDWDDLSTEEDNGTYRIYRFDDAAATGTQALRVAKSATSDHYWIGYRKDSQGLEAYSQGAYMTWERAGDPDRNQSWLIDTTPGSTNGKNDAPVTLGRTYADTASEVYITPVAKGGTTPNEYIDVVVNFGPFSGNNAPAGTLSGPIAIDARQLVLFSASVTDADSDTLAYAWDMGDGVIQANAPSITHSWIKGGNYAVSLTISDMKGGSTILTKNINVANPVETWSSRSSGTLEHLKAVAANDTYVVAVVERGGSAAEILRSPDGSTWNSVFPDSYALNLYCDDVVRDGTGFLLVGQDYDNVLVDWEGVVYSSPDGQIWKRAYERNVANSKLIAIASDGSGSVVAFEENGTIVHRTPAGTWSTVNIGIGSTTVLKDIAYGEGYFVLVGHKYEDDAPEPTYNGDVEVWRSTDGLNWLDVSSGTGLDTWKDLRVIAHSGSHFVASGFYSRAMYSTDQGQTWSSNQSGDIHQVEGFAQGGGLHYAVGINKDDGDADIDLISTDGLSWTPFDPGALDDRNDITFFNNTFITVGENGTIRQSDAFTTSIGYDSFASTHFPGGGADAAATSNPDFDWANNLIEYALGGIPNAGNSSPTKPMLSFDESDYAVFEISRDSKQQDVAYSVWWSTDLAEWTQADLTVETDSATSLKVRSNKTFSDQDKAFFKLQLSQ
jgi:hypothetical protein